MARLDIDALRSFVAIASFAGVGRAAQALHLSQSTVSGHLRRLESDVGVKLVERVGRGVGFTLAGDELARRAHAILDLHDAALDALASADEHELVVAASDLAATPLLFAASAVLADRYPGRTVRYRTLRSESLRELVHSHRADVALTFAPSMPGAVPIGTMELRWYGPANGPQPDDRDLVAFTRPCRLREVMLAAALEGSEVRRESLDLVGVLDAVRSGVGITALPRHYSRDQRLRPLPHLAPPPPLELSIVVGPRIGDEARERLIAELSRAAATGAVV